MPEFVRKGPILDWIYEYDEGTGEFTKTDEKRNILLVEAVGMDGNVHTVSVTAHWEADEALIEFMFVGAEQGLKQYMIAGKVWG